MHNRAALDWLNFLLADVQGGVGPFLAIYLWSSQGWDATHVGVIMTIAGIATVAARAPAGALVDWIVWKRSLIVVAAGNVALGAIVLSLFPLFWPAAAAQTLIGASDAAFPPAIAAISLGIVGRQAFTGWIGRNEAFNHAGNVFTDGGRSTPEVQLLQPLIFLFLVLDVFPDRSFVSPHGRDEISSRPEMLPYKIAPLFPVNAGQMNRTLALHISDQLRNRVFRWDRNHHVHMIRHHPSSIRLSFCVANLRSNSPR